MSLFTYPFLLGEVNNCPSSRQHGLTTYAILYLNPEVIWLLLMGGCEVWIQLLRFFFVSFLCYGGEGKGGRGESTIFPLHSIIRRAIVVVGDVDLDVDVVVLEFGYIRCYSSGKWDINLLPSTITLNNPTDSVYFSSNSTYTYTKPTQQANLKSKSLPNPSSNDPSHQREEWNFHPSPMIVARRGLQDQLN